MLRVAVVPGGCSGLTYDLGWDTTRLEDDQLLEIAGIRVVLDRRSSAYIDGTELDFSDGFEGRGFHFHEPAGHPQLCLRRIVRACSVIIPMNPPHGAML